MPACLTDVTEGRRHALQSVGANKEDSAVGVGANTAVFSVMNALVACAWLAQRVGALRSFRAPPLAQAPSRYSLTHFFTTFHAMRCHRETLGSTSRCVSLLPARWRRCRYEEAAAAGGGAAWLAFSRGWLTQTARTAVVLCAAVPAPPRWPCCAHATAVSQRTTHCRLQAASAQQPHP